MNASKKFRDGDVVRWSYTPEKLKKLNDGYNNGTTYWCNSQFAVFREERGLFEDTYWGVTGGNKYFAPDDPDIELNYLGNFDEWDECGRSETEEDLEKKYKKEDIISLKHSNSFGNNLYLKKGAKKDIDIIRANLEDDINAKRRESKYLLRQAERKEEILNNLSENNLDEVWF